ncbi:MAG: hypothetical protein JWO38_7269 [Gemmataceae bacterium]|nr:hypothetical protein [Gemmataceae bacterium]
MPPEQPFIAYELYPGTRFDIEPAPIPREWMDKAPQRFPYRCLPLAIANQCGWVLKCPVGFRAYWYGGPAKEDVELRFDGPPDNRIMTHFGVGTITFSVPYLFRTPPGINLWVKGPSNWLKDGVQPLEGVVETDWLASTFTMNWKITRMCEWIQFDQGEPICMLVPIPRGLTESLVPRRVPLATEPELQEQYNAWQESRKGFLQGLQTLDPTAVRQGWQKDYFQGKTPDGEEFEGHQTRLSVREFATAEAPAPSPPKDEAGTH